VSDRDDDACRPLEPKSRDGGAHRRACGEPVIDENRRLTSHVGERSRTTVEPFASIQLGLLHRRDALQVVSAHPRDANEFVIKDTHAAAGQRAHGKLFVGGQTQLSYDEHIERCAEGACNLVRDRYPAARKRQDDNVVTVRVCA